MDRGLFRSVVVIRCYRENRIISKLPSLILPLRSLSRILELRLTPLDRTLRKQWRALVDSGALTPFKAKHSTLRYTLQMSSLNP